MMLMTDVGGKLTASVSLVSYLWRRERGFQLTKQWHICTLDSGAAHMVWYL